MDRGGIEPPTPGFSVGLSSAPDSLLTGDNLSGCDSSGNGEESGAQQKAQHEAAGTTFDHRLERLIERWPTLTEDVRLRVLELISRDCSTRLTIGVDGEAV